MDREDYENVHHYVFALEETYNSNIRINYTYKQSINYGSQF